MGAEDILAVLAAAGIEYNPLMAESMSEVGIKEVEIYVA